MVLLEDVPGVGDALATIPAPSLLDPAWRAAVASGGRSACAPSLLPVPVSADDSEPGGCSGSSGSAGSPVVVPVALAIEHVFLTPDVPPVPGPSSGPETDGLAHLRRRAV
jgi:hypothetical protein